MVVNSRIHAISLLKMSKYFRITHIAHFFFFCLYLYSLNHRVDGKWDWNIFVHSSHEQTEFWMRTARCSSNERYFQRDSFIFQISWVRRHMKMIRSRTSLAHKTFRNWRINSTHEIKTKETITHASLLTTDLLSSYFSVI